MSEAQNLPSELLNRKDAAKYIRERWSRPCTVGVLEKAAVFGNGPAYRKIGRWVVYEKADIDRWIISIMSDPVRSTAEWQASKTA